MSLVRAAGRGERLDRLHAAADGRRAVHVDQPPRRVPGLVGVEGVDHQRERLRACAPTRSSPSPRVNTFAAWYSFSWPARAGSIAR